MLSRAPVLAVVTVVAVVQGLRGDRRSGDAPATTLGTGPATAEGSLPRVDAEPDTTPGFSPRPPRRRRSTALAVASLAAVPVVALAGGLVPLPGAAPATAVAADSEQSDVPGPVAPENPAPSAGALLAERAAAARQATRGTARVPVDDVYAERAAQVAAEREAAAREAARPEVVAPVAVPVGSPFGYRWGRLHAGLDFPAPIGTPIHAAADGAVEKAGPASGYGNLVTIRHADGLLTAYGHMRVVGVVPGQAVRAGDVIAEVGNEGRSTGPHLHFEVRTSGGPVDPKAWFAGQGINL